MGQSRPKQSAGASKGSKKKAHAPSSRRSLLEAIQKKPLALFASLIFVCLVTWYGYGYINDSKGSPVREKRSSSRRRQRAAQRDSREALPPISTAGQFARKTASKPSSEHVQEIGAASVEPSPSCTADEREEAAEAFFTTAVTGLKSALLDGEEQQGGASDDWAGLLRRSKRDLEAGGFDFLEDSQGAASGPVPLPLVVDTPVLPKRKEDDDARQPNLKPVGNTPLSAASAQRHRGGQSVDYGSFERAIEVGGMKGTAAFEQYLSGFALDLQFKTFRRAVLDGFAPKTALAAGLGGACEAASDQEVSALLSGHHKRCRYTHGVVVEVEKALKEKTRLAPPNDWPRNCKGNCLVRLHKSFAPVQENYYSVVKEVSVPANAAHQTFANTCAPLFSAIVESCGERRGLSVLNIAKGHARSGGLEVILGAARKGYVVVEDGDDFSGGLTHIPILLSWAGFVSQAQAAVREMPEWSLLRCEFGISVADHFAARAMPVTHVNVPALRLRGDEYEGLSDQENGGWPSFEIPFPGGEESQHDYGGGGCDIAEVSGMAVLENPQLFLEEFVLKRRPVVIRDYVRHDSSLEELNGLMARDTIVQDWAHGIWETGAIPYESMFTSSAPRTMAFKQFVEFIVEGPRRKNQSAGVTKPPPYIFSGSLKLDGDDADVAREFPQTPHFIDEGIPGVVKPQKGSGQFYLGKEGTGAGMHYHSNAAWNSLVYGSKGWVLTRPEDAVFSNVPAAIKVVEIAEGRDNSRGPESDVLRCVQNAGDVMVVPAQWGHLTYNLKTSIGLAKEFVLAPDFQGRAAQQKKQSQKPPRGAMSASKGSGGSSAKSSNTNVFGSLSGQRRRETENYPSRHRASADETGAPPKKREQKYGQETGFQKASEGVEEF